MCTEELKSTFWVLEDKKIRKEKEHAWEQDSVVETVNTLHWKNHVVLETKTSPNKNQSVERKTKSLFQFKILLYNIHYGLV